MYKLQKDDYSCGPIALYNLLKGHYNFPVTLKGIALALNTTHTGTHDSDMDNVLRMMAKIFSFKLRKGGHNALLTHISQCGEFIIGYQEPKGEKEWHYSYGIGYGETIMLTNYSDGVKFSLTNTQKLPKVIDENSIWLIGG